MQEDRWQPSVVQVHANGKSIQAGPRAAHTSLPSNYEMDQLGKREFFLNDLKNNTGIRQCVV